MHTIESIKVDVVTLPLSRPEKLTIKNTIRIYEK
jgi:hypothetical protein